MIGIDNVVLIIIIIIIPIAGHIAGIAAIGPHTIIGQIALRFTVCHIGVQAPLIDVVHLFASVAI